MGSNGERAARQIQAVFRSVNERIREKATDSPVNEIDFFCECGEAACGARVTLAVREFDELCHTSYFIVAEHEGAAARDAAPDTGAPTRDGGQA